MNKQVNQAWWKTIIIRGKFQVYVNVCEEVNYSERGEVLLHAHDNPMQGAWGAIC